jgi:mannitol-1-phosphate 5-dehydrogenase
MSGVVGAKEIKERNLAPVTPHEQRAFLVESFDRILISKLPDSGFTRGITVFEEKPDLLPFEEAKLYGHNSTHAVAAYLGAFLGEARISDLKKYPGIQNFLECAFIQESGAALTQKYQNTDPLFTAEGYRAYAKDLLVRMFNLYLGDTVERVARDPARKLEWDDRLVGTIRLCLRHGIDPRRYAIGAAAAVAALDPSVLSTGQVLDCIMQKLWANSASNRLERSAVLNAIEKGGEMLKLWRYSGYPDLERFVSEERAGNKRESLGKVPEPDDAQSE